ncbi:hypothetical protein [Ectobacillus polymachus]|uniref:flagellar biosynthesis protein FlhF n=1 Tax=Ectobacillus polymachus TaxID=1508806 RepID=UPI003A84C27A
MKMKTYYVNHMEQAYPMILRELGNEAIILKTTPIRSRGFLGLFGKKQIEVIAASGLGKSVEKTSESVTNAPAPTSSDSVMKELAEMKQLIQSMTVENPHPKMNKWVQRLQDQEVDQEVIDYIMKKVTLIHKNKDDIQDAEMTKTLLAILMQLLAEGITHETRTDSCVIMLLGPTGVGKTTTIAKLSAIHMLNQRQRVGLLTTDTYRIAAVEQLRTYANILNVPIRVVSEPNELKSSLESLENCQIVFLDSAGRNYLDPANIDDINHYLDQDFPQENYLVLSMTTRWKDMKTIVEKMKSVRIDKLIVTKWDETNCFGAVLNMVYHYPYPLSYIGIGQGVPQDIITPDPTFIAKKILGVDEDERSSSTFERII